MAGERWEAGAAFLAAGIACSSPSSSVLGQMAPTAPELTARLGWFYLWSLIKFPFLKVTLSSGASSGAVRSLQPCVFVSVHAQNGLGAAFFSSPRTRRWEYNGWKGQMLMCRHLVTSLVLQEASALVEAASMSMGRHRG